MTIAYIECSQQSRDGGVQTVAPKAKVLKRERVRWETAGENHRLVVGFDFRRQIAFVKFIGSHAECDRIDASKVSRF